MSKSSGCVVFVDARGAGAGTKSAIDHLPGRFGESRVDRANTCCARDTALTRARSRPDPTCQIMLDRPNVLVVPDLVGATPTPHHSDLVVPQKIAHLVFARSRPLQRRTDHRFFVFRCPSISQTCDAVVTPHRIEMLRRSALNVRMNERFQYSASNRQSGVIRARDG